MDKYQREATPRELTDEETKAVSGGSVGGKGSVPWSNAGGTPDGNWRDNK